jgi:hypothetical protein
MQSEEEEMFNQAVLSYLRRNNLPHQQDVDPNL